MKKLIIQIPCWNEEQTLAVTLQDLPRKLQGIERVAWLVVDDGSSDRTAEVAKQHGVDHIISHHKNQGLASAFMTGLQACLKNGADIIVNTDADNQYCAEDIPKLIQPILDGQAEIVVGERPIQKIEEFSFSKKLFQRIGSWVVRIASGTDIKDAPSGFRAFSASAARRINVFNRYTYTLETIIQAGQKDIPIVSVPIRTNRYLRPSRLIRSVPRYIIQSIITIFRIFVVYKPFRFFMTLGSVVFAVGVLIGARFLIYYFYGDGGGHVQSLILAGILIGIGFQTVMVAFVADLLSVNRRLLEELQSKNRRQEPESPKVDKYPTT